MGLRPHWRFWGDLKRWTELGAYRRASMTRIHHRGRGLPESLVFTDEGVRYEHPFVGALDLRWSDALLDLLASKVKLGMLVGF